MMDESTKSRIGGVQPIPVRGESKRRRWLLLLLTILLLTSIGVITGILLHTSNKYDLSSYTQTTTPAEFKKMTLQELAQTLTSDSLTDRTTTGPADFKTTKLQMYAQNMTIDLSTDYQTTTTAEYKTSTMQGLAQIMTKDSSTDYQTTTGPEDLKTTKLQLSAQNMTIDLSTDYRTTTTAEYKTSTMQGLAQIKTKDSSTDYQTTTGPEDLKTTKLQLSAQSMARDLSTDYQTTTTAEYKTSTIQGLAQIMTKDSSTDYQTTTGSADFKTKLQLSAQNMTIGSRGKAFLVLFMRNDLGSTKNIYIISENGAQMNITTSPRLDISLKAKIDREVYISSSQHIVLPPELNLYNTRKEEKAVLIETSSDVFVISQDESATSVGSTTHIPLHKLSTKYLVITTNPIIPWFTSVNRYSQLAVAAIEDNTTVAITIRLKLNPHVLIQGKRYADGDVFTFSLDRFQIYQIIHMVDLTGTFVESSAPVAVFSGNDCNRLEHIYIDVDCDHLVEQLPPITSVDNIYIVPPNMDNRDTIIRIAAIENTNITFVIGGVIHSRFLHKFDYFNTKISSSQTCLLESETPFLVTAFGLHSKRSSMGDPSMTIVPGINQYIDYYKIFVTLGYDHNYLSIMIENSSKDSLRVNSSVVETSDIVFEDNVLVRNISYNVRTIRVTEGELTASTLNRERFGLTVAGVANLKAYGFSGNSVFP